MVCISNRTHVLLSKIATVGVGVIHPLIGYTHGCVKYSLKSEKVSRRVIFLLSVLRCGFSSEFFEAADVSLWE